jgi:hypothetical protein
MQPNLAETLTIDELVDELMRRSVAGYFVLWAFDSKSGDTFKYEDWKGDTELLVGPLKSALEEAMPLNPIWEGEIEDDEWEEVEDDEEEHV